MNSFINNLKLVLKKVYVHVKYSKFLPSNPMHSDIYIVEFPKSGITWFSNIIANLNVLQSKIDMQATHYNVQQLIPDIHLSKELAQSPMWTVPPYRIIKSHYEYCPGYKNVIYLVRNPVSVMNSYYHYQKSLGQFDGSLLDFVKSSNGIESWCKHTSSWLLRGDTPQRIHVVKYEDLIDKPLETISELYNNLGVLVDSGNIEKAVELASFANMKENEKMYKQNNPNRNLKFVREGSSKAVNVSDDVIEYINQKAKNINKVLGY